MKSQFSALSFFCAIVTIYLFMSTGCANMVPPTGGPKDSLPPVLVAAVPKDSSTGIHANKIVLTFNEYVDVQNAQQQLIVSPVPKSMPLVESKLKTVTIKLRDSLEPNTTYSLNFGTALKDANEGNVSKNFTYVFSTGNQIDQQTIKGKVRLAETGKYDSTLLVMLHSDKSDTAIYKKAPRYYTTVDKDGNFEFNFLPKQSFNIFVLPNDYSKRYDDSTKTFAFASNEVMASDTGAANSIMLYAYNEAVKKEKPATTNNNANKNKETKDGKGEDKRLKVVAQLEGGKQDLLNDSLHLVFNRKLKTVDTSKIILTDTNHKAITGYRFYIDTNRTHLSMINKWASGIDLIMIIEKDVATDSAGVALSKADTIRFSTKKDTEYGAVKIKFNNLDLGKNPVLQMVKGDDIVKSIPLATNIWSQQLFLPGDYEMRILFDDNKNGIWDAGDYKKRKQPEIVMALSKKISIRANWDNESEVVL